MKIGFVLDDTLDVGDGVQQAVLTIGEHMRSEGHDIHYLVGLTHRTDIKNVHSLAKTIRVTFNGNKMRMPLPTNGRKIRKFLLKENFDVLHIQMPYSPLFAGKVILNAPKTTRIVGTFHILPYSKINSYSTRLLGMVLRRSINNIDHVVSVSEPARVFCLDTFRVDSIVIPNPINVSKFKNSLLAPKFGRKKIVFLGRLVERKGAAELVKAFIKLMNDHKEMIKDTELIIAGKGEQYEMLRSMASGAPKGTQITFLGFVDEDSKASLLASADLAVFPSKGGESFGIVLIEAMAAGSRLILAGDNPGYRSVMHSYQKLLVDPTNLDKFSDKLYELLQENKENSELSVKLHDEVVQYDVQVVEKKLLELYES